MTKKRIFDPSCFSIGGILSPGLLGSDVFEMRLSLWPPSPTFSTWQEVRASMRSWKSCFQIDILPGGSRIKRKSSSQVNSLTQCGCSVTNIHYRSQRVIWRKKNFYAENEGPAYKYILKFKICLMRFGTLEVENGIKEQTAEAGNKPWDPWVVD